MTDEQLAASGISAALRKNKRVVEDNPTQKRRAALGDITNCIRQDASVSQKPIQNSVRTTAVDSAVAKGRTAPQLATTDVFSAVYVEQEEDGPSPMAVEKVAPAARQTSAYRDIDNETRDDPQSVAAYVQQIYANLAIKEIEYQPMDDYMESTQRDINPTMRAILVDWLVEVAEEYKLKVETLYLTINYIDRFLGHVPVVRGKLQLVGITAMLIAAKYEEIYAPAVDEFVYISDNTYTRDEVLKMEIMILTTLTFELTIVTPKVFLMRFVKAAEVDERTALLSEYLTELTLPEYSFLRFLPSVVAASAVCVGRYALGLPDWTPQLEHYTTYSRQALEPCVVALLMLYRNAASSNLQAIREKYSHHNRMRVSAIPLP